MSIKQEAKTIIEQFFHALNTQDLELMEKLIPKSETTVHVGTDEGEIWKGWKMLNDATKEQFKNLEYYKAKYSRSGDQHSPIKKCRLVLSSP